MSENRPPPAVGDKIVITTRPFISTWEVTQVTEYGIVAQYVGDVQFIGYGSGGIHLPLGTVADRADETWLGAAHWPEITYLTRAGDSDV